MIVYLIRNVINGKGYVGQTSRSAEARWIEHCREARYGTGCRSLHEAIREHGEDSFVVSVLYEAKNFEDLNEAEVRLIKELGTCNPDGYNLRLGGYRGALCAESRARIADAHRIYRAPSKTPEEALFWARKASENFPRNVASKMKALVGALLGDGN